MDERAFLLTQNLFRFREMHEKVKKIFGINWLDTQWTDLRVPFYSGLAARLSLSVGPQPLPCTIAKQGIFWKKYYNTAYYNYRFDEYYYIENRNDTVRQFLEDAESLRDIEGMYTFSYCADILLCCFQL